MSEEDKVARLSKGIAEDVYQFLLSKECLATLSISGEEPKLNHTLDSENLADLVGTTVAYSAYSALPQKYKDVGLAGFDMSTDRLFFVNNCAKWCAQNSVANGPYAPQRSRCIVPLMNMPAFSSAFGCAAGTPMNPRKKCTFW
ncbi:membrane metallo-endopeptidase-like 1 [Rhipicephalus microplus]|uniref:membrane metallo-endopeptidase-like 1 n=1 Tax=Rhipicephalus microplus TaxID=6941 RepID=UPI003F6CDABC